MKRRSPEGPRPWYDGKTFSVGIREGVDGEPVITVTEHDPETKKPRKVTTILRRPKKKRAKRRA